MFTSILTCDTHELVMSEQKVCSCDTSFLRFLLNKFLRKKSECNCHSLVGSLAIMDRPEVETPGGWGEDQRPEAVGPSVQEPEEEVEEDVRMCVDMASLSVVRPHTQIDYYHHLVPHLSEITNSSYYWGKMDRYEAEDLLEDKPEGSFLLRDSAQDEYLFSVSFRRYGRSLHARIEEQNHEFSFDCHDPGVYMNRNIPALLDHYKDPASCMFFEPMLCHPVNKKNAFSLQSLARAAICDSLQMYTDVDQLELPKSLKVFLKEYHYRHRLRVHRYDLDS